MKVAIFASALAVTLLFPTVAVRGADGDPDPSFGGTGVVTETVDGYAGAHAVAIQDDGKIVAAGYTALVYNGTFSIALARFNPDGTLDSGFGSGGLVSGVPGTAVDLVVQPDGKLVALAIPGVFRLVRFDDDGTLDASFGTAGIATIDCGSNVTQPTATLALQPDGKLVAAGPLSDGSTCLARFLADGTPDPSFGSSGVALIPDLHAAALAVQPDGKLLTGGYTSGGFDLAVARVLDDGSLDGGFGSHGIAVTDLGPSASIEATAIVVQPNGHIVASLTIGGTIGDFGVARYTAKGKPDPTFGTDGITVTSGSPNVISTTADDVVLQRDGKILIVGTILEFVSPPAGGYVTSQLARYDTDGSLDPTFGTNGIQPGGGSGEAIRVQSDGKAVTVGTAAFFTDSAFIVSRYSALTIDCPATATPACTTTTAPAASSLKLDAVKDRLQWKWGKGAATMLTDFGDPITTTAYSLCLYDESGGSILLDGATIPPGGTCAGKPCWQPKGTTGFSYKDRFFSRFGIAALKLKAGVTGKAQVQIRGQGSVLPLPALPLTLPVRVQLRGNGQCWDAVFSSPGASRNDGERFQGKSD